MINKQHLCAVTDRGVFLSKRLTAPGFALYTKKIKVRFHRCCTTKTYTFSEKVWVFASISYKIFF